MNKVLWVLQVLLAAAFLAHGLLFLNPPAEVVEQLESRRLVATPPPLPVAS